MVLYFYVVPQLESKLTSQKIDALQRDSATYSRPFEDAIAREVTAGQLDALTSLLSEQTGARVTRLDREGWGGGGGGKAGDQVGAALNAASRTRTTGTLSAGRPALACSASPIVPYHALAIASIAEGI